MNVHSIALNPTPNNPACHKVFSEYPPGNSLLRKPHHKHHIPESDPVSALVSQQLCQEHPEIKSNGTSPSLP